MKEVVSFQLTALPPCGTVIISLLQDGDWSSSYHYHFCLSVIKIGEGINSKPREKGTCPLLFKNVSQKLL
jgi:hypothetical protein